MLRDLGYGVTEASGAGEALESVRGASPDALVTDQLMPGMNGTRLAAEARAAWPELPVLLVTGGAAPEAPGYAQLAKPIRHAELARAMATLLGGH
jgi:CheY-like chemotaxis protein